MTNIEILCFVLGWQGGTVHQVAERLERDTEVILNASPDQMRVLCREAQKKRDPLPILLKCPECGARHVDANEFATKPHHTHSCQTCGHTWRPAVAPTVGVQFLPGFKDAPPAAEDPKFINGG